MQFEFYHVPQIIKHQSPSYLKPNNDARRKIDKTMPIFYLFAVGSVFSLHGVIRMSGPTGKFELDRATDCSWGLFLRGNKGEMDRDRLDGTNNKSFVNKTVLTRRTLCGDCIFRSISLHYTTRRRK